MPPRVPEGATGSGQLLMLRELADFLAVSEQALRKWCERGLVPHGKLEGGGIRFDRDEVQQWLDDRWTSGSQPSRKVAPLAHSHGDAANGDADPVEPDES